MITLRVVTCSDERGDGSNYGDGVIGMVVMEVCGG